MFSLKMFCGGEALGHGEIHQVYFHRKLRCTLFALQKIETRRTSIYMLLCSNEAWRLLTKISHIVQEDGDGITVGRR